MDRHRFEPSSIDPKICARCGNHRYSMIHARWSGATTMTDTPSAGPFRTAVRVPPGRLDPLHTVFATP